MQSDVRPLPVNPAGGWDEDAITSIDPRGPRAARHRNLLRAALLLLDPSVLWTNAMRAQWKLLTGKDEATTRALCDAIREAGLSIDQFLL